MTEKMLARVAVSSVPYAADRLYTYLVPDELIGSAEVGKRVTIPFGRGNRRVEGFLLEVGREAAASPLKPIDAVLDDAPLLDAKDIRLVRWMKARYFCTYYDAIKTILPGGVWLQYRELWHVNGEISAEDALSSVAPDSLEETLLRAMLSAKEIDRGALDELGGEKTAKALRSLEACGLAVRETKLRQRLQDKSVRMVSLCVSAEDALAAVEPKRRSAHVRYAVVELLSRDLIHRSATTPARRCKRCAASKRPVLSNFLSVRCCASAAMMMRPRARTLCSTANSRPLSTASVRS